MPKFLLRSWQEQTLYDCRDYEVEADTLDEAVDKLANAQQQAEDAPYPYAPILVDGITSTQNGRLPGVCQLEPDEIVDGDSGICEIDADGNVIDDENDDA